MNGPRSSPSTYCRSEESAPSRSYRLHSPCFRSRWYSHDSSSVPVSIASNTLSGNYPQTITGSYPFGGHYRIDVKDGAIVSQRAFARSCLEMPVPKGQQPMAMAVMHLLDPIPTEIHVFNVYASGIPVIVIAQGQRMYAIELKGGQANIRLVKPSK